MMMETKTKRQASFLLFGSALILVFLLLPFFATRTKAAIPKLLNFQGKLTNASDNTNVADGSYAMQFKIYDAASSGNLLWTENWDATTSKVSLTNGVFTVKLGTYTNLDNIDFTSGSLYLSVNFAPTGVAYDGEMSPRKQLVSSAFAFNANSLVGTGRIGITTTSSTSSAASINYSPDSATATPAVIITASSNVTGPALKVTQNGSGYSAVLTGGNVGIGTITPTSTLFVQGSGAINPFVVASSTGTALLTVAPTGSTTLSSLGTGIVRSSSGSLYTDNSTYLTSALTSISALTGPAISVATTSDTNITISISTTTANTLTFIPGWSGTLAVSRGGSGASSFTPGFVLTGQSASAFTSGIIRDNGTVAGINATSATVSFFVQTGSGLDPFIISSTTSVNYLTVKANGLVGIGSSTPVATLSVQGTSTLPDTPVFIVASHTGTSLLTVAANGSTTLSSLGTGCVGVSTGGLYTTACGAGSGAAASGTPGMIQFYNSASNLNSTPYFQFDNVGDRLAVGTTSTSSTFTLQGQAGTANLFTFASSSKGSLFSMDFLGNLNIATSTSGQLMGTDNNKNLISISLATGTGSTDFNISTTTNRITFNIPTAANGVRGLLNSTDWNTFNNKQAALTNPDTGTGVSGQVAIWSGSTALTGDQGFLWSTSNHNLAINSSTPNATLVAQGSSTNPTLDILRVSSSTNVTYLQVNNIGSTTLSSLGTGPVFSSSGALYTQGTTGTGAVVQQTSPTLVTPVLGTASSTNLTVGTNLWVSGATNSFLSTDSGGKVIATTTPLLSISNLTGPQIWVATTSDTNIVISISTTTANTLTFQPSWAGSLAIARGGMGTTTWQTGSIPFYGGSNFTENNPAFIWQNTTRSLLINTTTPTGASLAVYASSSANTLPIFIVGTTTGSNYLTVAANGSTTLSTLGTGCVGVSTGALYTTACGAGSGAAASGTPGMIQFYNSASNLNSTALFQWDNVTARHSIGTTSTSSTVTIQGQAGSANLLTVASSSAGNVFTITAAGNVGIGSASPNSVLVVQGNSIFPTAQLFEVASSSGASFLHVMASGNVGIGTSTPTATFHTIGTSIFQPVSNTASFFQVQNASGSPIILVDANNNINIVANPGFEVNTNGWGATTSSVTISRVTTHKYFGLAALSIVTNAAAHVGASSTLFTTALQTATQYTLSFYARLDPGAAAFTTLEAGRYDNGISMTACTLNSNTVRSDGWTRFFCTFTTGTVSGTPGIFIGQSDATARTFYIDSVQLQTGSNATPYQIGNIQLRGVITNPQTFMATSNSVTALQIQDVSGTQNLFVANTLNGRIGIGTTTPAVRLAIQGTTTSDDLLDIATNTGASFFRVTANGRVGINSSTPQATLAAQGRGTLPTTDIFSAASSSGQSYFKVTSRGNVSIGSSSPNAFFTVASTTLANSIPYIIVSNTGNIGINTTSPNAKFAVAANCSGFASAAGGRCTDYAEFYSSSEPVNKAEIISAGKIDAAVFGLVRKSRGSYDSAVIGVVSSNPAVIIEGNGVQMMNGADYQLDPTRPAIALAGRVPVRITGTEVIHAGDFITSSNIPGVGMKATRAGEVVGQALEDFDPAANTDPNPTILTFIKVGYQAITDALVLDSNNSSGLNLSSPSANSDAVLRQLLAGNSSDGSQIVNADRVIAGLDVITPAIKAATITANSIITANLSSPILDDLRDQLGLITDLASTTSAKVDKVSSRLDEIASTTTAEIADLSSRLQNLTGQYQALSISAAQLQATSSGLTVNGPVTFSDGIKTDTISAINGGIAINGDVYFLGRPYFITDTAGFAIIKQNAAAVDITFDQPYLDQPIVNASITQNADASATPEQLNSAANVFTQSVFGNGIQFVITNKSQTGFSITLNKPAPVDVSFSWIALAVKSPKLFSSKDPALPNAPEVLGASVSVSSGTSTPPTDASTTPSTPSSTPSTADVPASTSTPVVIDTTTPATTDTQTPSIPSATPPSPSDESAPSSSPPTAATSPADPPPVAAGQ